MPSSFILRQIVETYRQEATLNISYKLNISFTQKEYVKLIIIIKKSYLDFGNLDGCGTNDSHEEHGN